MSEMSESSTADSVQTRELFRGRHATRLKYVAEKVLNKVKEQKCTTYAEVANELVREEAEYVNLKRAARYLYSIRRRVYDCLNVLVAVGIFARRGKNITYRDCQSEKSLCIDVEKDSEQRLARINEKRLELFNILCEQACYRSLVKRNKDSENRGLIPQPNSSISLPFLVVKTAKDTQTFCEALKDKSHYHLSFQGPFQVLKDSDVLDRLGLLKSANGKCYIDLDLLKSWIPPNSRKFIDSFIEYSPGEASNRPAILAKEENDTAKKEEPLQSP